jgi:hypothetical protein
MEFYKEGRVLTLATGTTLDLSAAQYNHKAAIILSEAPSGGDTITIKFYTQGAKSAAVPFSASTYADSSMSSNAFTNALIPVRLSEINTSGAIYNITVTLFS